MASPWPPRVMANARLTMTLHSAVMNSNDLAPSHTLSGARLYVVLATLAVTTAISAATVAGTVLNGSSADVLHSREREIIVRHQRELRILRNELQAVRTRHSVEQSRLADRARRLADRSNWLNALRDESDDDGTQLLRLGQQKTATGDDLLAAVEDSLRRAERRQLGDIAKLGTKLAARTRKLARILKMHGIEARAASGGPLIAFKGSAPFDERMAAFEAAEANYRAIRERIDHLPQGSPVPGRKISSRFGTRRDPLNGRQALHGGLDFSAPKGDPVRATAAGTVEFAGRRGGYGKLIVIDHGNGMTTRFGHLSSIGVVKGERITRGALIGKVGSTGRSTGPHLHYEVRRRGQVRDPAHYVRLERRLKPLM